METPVAIIIFNRPEITARLLDALAAVRPSSLYVIADGPRPDCHEDIERCQAARALIKSIDWHCRIETCFSDINLGCKYRPETGINWLFTRVEEAIILEDDCLPHPSFFPYCQELLERYRHDSRVMAISGYNFFGRSPSNSQSYYFSTLGSTWGWATWRRAWALNDPLLEKWPLVVDSRLIEHLFPDPTHSRYWHDVFNRILDGRLPDAWDYQWLLSCWLNSGFRIFPSVSLVANVGFGDNATHTFGENPYLNLADEIGFPLRHPEIVTRCFEADAAIAERFCSLEGYRQLPPPPPSLYAQTRSLLGRLARQLPLPRGFRHR